MVGEFYVMCNSESTSTAKSFFMKREKSRFCRGRIFWRVAFLESRTRFPWNISCFHGFHLKVLHALGDFRALEVVLAPIQPIQWILGFYAK